MVSKSTANISEKSLDHAMHVLNDVLCKIRAYAFTDPQSVHQLADAAHNIPYAILSDYDPKLHELIELSKKALYQASSNARDRQKPEIECYSIIYHWEPIEDSGNTLVRLQAVVDWNGKSPEKFNQIKFLLEQLSVNLKRAKLSFNANDFNGAAFWDFTPEAAALVAKVLERQEDWTLSELFCHSN